MMRMLAFTVYDSKAEVFAKPFFEVTRGSAIRAFSDAVNEPGHVFNKHADDFTLYECGAFDDALGKFEPAEPTTLGTAMIYKTDEASDFRPMALEGGD